MLSCCDARLEQAKEDESRDALKDLVNLVTCLTTYGVTELKPAGLTTGAPFLLPGFVLPQPSGKGEALEPRQSFKWAFPTCGRVSNEVLEPRVRFGASVKFSNTDLGLQIGVSNKGLGFSLAFEDQAKVLNQNLGKSKNWAFLKPQLFMYLFIHSFIHSLT